MMMRSTGFLAMVCALIVVAMPAAQAALNYTFDSDIDVWEQDAVWASPTAWADGGTLQQSSTAGGWTMGGLGPKRTFDQGTENAMISAWAAAGTGTITFDLIVDGDSFPPATGVWYNINLAGNSGLGNWNQVEKVTGDAWHNADDPAVIADPVSVTFDQVGWQTGDAWYQLNLGSNSAAENPVNFYVDNLVIAPEPGTMALLWLGVAALCLGRRRK